MTLRIKRSGARLPRNSHETDMTQGNILRHIITFAFPLLVGNLFQQMYNTVDTWVVGNYVSNTAFSAVGAIAPIVNLFIGTFTGLASGAGVVISQYYGAKKFDKVNQTVHSAILLTALLAVIMTALGLAVVPYLLKAINLHTVAYEEAKLYLTVYIAGIVGLMVYNMGAAILRAVGDSKRPFYFLLVSAVLNTVLDLLFVLQFNMGVFGVALATIIAQAVSAALVLLTLLKTNGSIQLNFRKLRLCKDDLTKILSIGIPASLQLGITSFSNIFVQSYITHFDVGLPSPDYMSGWTSYLKVDQVLLLPMQSISLAVSTFVGQNLGSGDVARAKKGVWQATVLSLAATAVLMVPVMVFAPNIVSFLNQRPQVVANGTMFLRVITPFYLLCCFNQIYASALRGAGDSRAPMFFMLTSFVLFRQTYLYIMARVCNKIVPIVMGYPACWLICSIMTGIYFYSVGLTKKHSVVNQ